MSTDLSRSYFIKFVPERTPAADPRPDKLFFRNLFRYEGEILRKHRGIIKQFKKLMRRHGRDVVSAYSLWRVIFHLRRESPSALADHLEQYEGANPASPPAYSINKWREFTFTRINSFLFLRIAGPNARRLFHGVLPRSSIFLNFFQVR